MGRRKIEIQPITHDGEQDTRGPGDFSGNTPGAKDDGDDEEGDEENEETGHPASRVSKRGPDGQLKQSHTDTVKSEIDYAPRTTSHTQHPLHLAPSSMSASHHHHQHPMSSDRLSGPMHAQSKKPRLGIPSNLDILRSRSDESPLSVISPEGSSRSTRYALDRDLSSAPRYAMPQSHRISQSPLPHNSPPSAHNRQRHPQYSHFLPSSAPGSTHYSQSGHTPPPPNFIPLHSQADFAASTARARSISGSSNNILPARNIYGSYGNEGNGSAGGSGGGGGGGASGDLFAAFVDAEQEARASMARRSSISGPGVGGGGSGGTAFGLDWPVHLPSSGAVHGGEGGGPKPRSHSSAERGTSAGSGGSASGNGSGSGPASGAEWLDFLSAASRGVRHASVATVSAEQPVATEPTPKETTPSFDTLQGVVADGVLAAVRAMKISNMSPVQAAVFPLLPQLARPYNVLEPSTGPARDLLVKAKTGTGKTLGFLIPAVEARLQSLKAHGVQAARDAGKEGDSTFEKQAAIAFARQSVGTLVISPTRELATQIAQEALRLTSKLDRENRDFGVRLFVGGEDKRRQLHQFRAMRNDIVVATPGRLRDLLESVPEVQKSISKTQVLVLDEADTLLDMGFRPDIEAIKAEIPSTPERQTFLFSATVSRAIQDIAESTLSPNHKFINCVSSEASPVHAHVPQYSTVLSDASEQLPHILRLIAHDQLSSPNASKIVLFLPTTKMTQLFGTILREMAKVVLPAGRKTNVYEIHSKKAMESRTRTSDNFRKDFTGASILVTSDVSARGVDYPAVSRVIQVGIPSSTEQYIHRVGRTGRAGTEGRGDLVVLPWEKGFLKQSLSIVPLKPLTAADLTTELFEMAKTHDADPAAFFSNAPPPKAQPTSRYNRRSSFSEREERLFKSVVTAQIEEIDRAIDSFRCKVDEEAIRETFMSLLGYYVARTALMGAHTDSVVQGLKDWTTQGAGLLQPPYVSEATLIKCGANAGNNRRNTGFRGGRGGSRGGGSYGSRSFGGRDGGSYGNRSFGGRDGGSTSRSYGSRDRDAGYSDGSSSYGNRENGSYGHSSHSRRNGGYGDRSYGGSYVSRSYGDRDGIYVSRDRGSDSRSRAPWMSRGQVKKREDY
ncbi:hypothetical protein H0H87_004456 [Tephrocybe sp. NHM501043]|nr:hypothetical protein H0H87_004456 [Tephrocybe sp. NHM501043]